MTLPFRIMPARKLKLNCLILGNDPSRIFTVEISDTENVSILKKEIRGENQDAFKDFDTKRLVLWKVSLPINRQFQQMLVSTCQVSMRRVYSTHSSLTRI